MQPCPLVLISNFFQHSLMIITSKEDTSNLGTVWLEFSSSLYCTKYPNFDAILPHKFFIKIRYSGLLSICSVKCYWMLFISKYFSPSFSTPGPNSTATPGVHSVIFLVGVSIKQSVTIGDMRIFVACDILRHVNFWDVNTWNVNILDIRML